MRTMHSTARIVISDASDTEFELEVPYTATPGSRDSYHPYYGWSQGDPPEVSIDGDVKCFEIAFHHGGGKTTRLPVEKKFHVEMGQFVMAWFASEIEEKLWEEAGKAAEEKYDPCDPRI